MAHAARVAGDGCRRLTADRWAHLAAGEMVSQIVRRLKLTNGTIQLSAEHCERFAP